MSEKSPIYNRLKKNLKKMIPWSKQTKVQAYRLYDKDIPSYPYQIDRYGEGHFVLYDKGKRLSSESEVEIAKERKEEVLLALNEIFDNPQIVIKERKVLKERQEQYQRKSYQTKRFSIQEGELHFWVDIENYLDTGLFLDHRPLRKKLIKESQDKTVLNLFGYTGSLSVAAAYGGATCSTVDLSNTYLDWARENFILNKLNIEAHKFIRADVVQWIDQDHKETYDIILLDPPTFSNSKKMDQSLDLQKDHPHLIQACIKLLSPKGRLYFSTNNHQFNFNIELKKELQVQDITSKMLPKDFNPKTKRFCFLITSKEE